MRYWDDLREPTANFAQMPFEILEAMISSDAKILYLHLWKNAFTNHKWRKGNMYAEMSYGDMANLLNCSQRWARTLTQQLIDCNLIEKHRGKHTNKYYFIKQRYWKFPQTAIRNINNSTDQS